ncbi:hypothetical protein ES708_15251 [subsurface metagenome]
MNKDSIGVGLIGLGVVAGGVARVLTGKAKALSEQVGCPLILRKVKVLESDLSRPQVKELGLKLFTTNDEEFFTEANIDAAYLVGHQVLLEGGNKRNAAADTGLVVQTDAVLLRQGEQLRPVLGDDLLVGGNHVPPASERPLQVIQSRLFTTDSLDHDIYVSFSKELLVVGGKKL